MHCMYCTETMSNSRVPVAIQWFLQGVFIEFDRLLSPWSLVKHQPKKKPLFKQMEQTMWEAIRSNPTCCFWQQSILRGWGLTGREWKRSVIPTQLILNEKKKLHDANSPQSNMITPQLSWGGQNNISNSESTCQKTFTNFFAGRHVLHPRGTSLDTRRKEGK